MPHIVIHAPVMPGSQPWLRLARLAKLLSSLTLIWLGIEGAIGVAAGILAGSIALVAFGLDRAIEGLASIIVIWRFSRSAGIEQSTHNLIGEVARGFGQQQQQLSRVEQRVDAVDAGLTAIREWLLGNQRMLIELLGRKG